MIVIVLILMKMNQSRKTKLKRNSLYKNIILIRKRINLSENYW